VPTVRVSKLPRFIVVVVAATLAACSGSGTSTQPATRSAANDSPTSSAAVGVVIPTVGAEPTAAQAQGATDALPTGRYTCWNVSNPMDPPQILWDMWIHDDGTYSTTSDTERWAFAYDAATKRVDFNEGSWADLRYFGDYLAAGAIVFDRVNAVAKIVIHDPALEASVGGNRDLINCDLRP